MKTMTSADPNAGYRAAPTASLALENTTQSSENGHLGRTAPDSIRLGHHENLTTSRDAAKLRPRSAVDQWRTFPFRGVVSLRSRPPRDYDKATSERFRVVRFDGVTLGGSTSRAVAERLRNVLCQGQRRDFATVVKRGES